MKTFLLLILLSGIYHDGWIDFNKNGSKDVYEDASAPLADRVENLLRQMTVEEKTCQLVTVYGTGRVLGEPHPVPGWKERVWKDGAANIDEELNGVGKAYGKYYDMIYPYSNHVKALNAIQKWFVEETRLGIPVEFSNEGIHGLDHTKATPLPAPIAIGCTWDRELVRRAGEVAGLEAGLLGYHSVYAPILDVARDPRWGRTLECYGEDPYLVAQLGIQMAAGIQSEGVSAGLKHFAAYSVPKGGRDGDCRTDPHITPRELHEIFLYPFKEVIRKVHPMVVMASYNEWNGEPVIASRYFLTELLRRDYGYDGYVVSDSEAVEFVHEKHQVTSSYPETAAKVLSAGMNVHTNFRRPELFVEALRQAISGGLVSEDVLDLRVREVLSVKFRLGLFDNPYTGDALRADREVGIEHNAEFVRRCGEESIVLLKNDGILPLDKTALKKILVTGPLAAEDNYMTSRYGPNGLNTVNMLDGMRDYLGDKVQVLYAKGCEVIDRNWPESEIVPEPMSTSEKKEIDRAVALAKKSDVVVAVMGEDRYGTGESRSRTSLDLPGRQKDLLMALHATGKPVVLVLVNGQPLTVNWENAKLPAIVETWFQSSEGGRFLPRVLFGDVNPSGKLAVTFPKAVGQIEYNFPFKKGSHNGQPSKGPNGTGRTRVNGVLYPFGYGLSYTAFEYGNLVVSKSGGRIMVDATISNVGKREGTEIVQLYVRDKVSSVVTYDSVLRGFERITLAPGESGKVHFELTQEDLHILDADMKWTAEPGEFEIMVGASSTDIRLRDIVEISSVCRN